MSRHAGHTPETAEAARPSGTDGPRLLSSERPFAATAPAAGSGDGSGDCPSSPPSPEPPAEDPRLAELQDRWHRALADLDNLRKRRDREVRRERAAERARVAGGWLSVLDNLELALEHADADPGSIVDGVRRVRDQAVELLRALGYPRHEEVGVPFDPRRHEVVALVDDAGTEPGTVVRVLRPGYGEAEDQLRAGAVAVSRRSE